MRYVLFILNIYILRRWRPEATCFPLPKREAHFSRIRVSSTFFLDSDSLERTRALLVCASLPKNVPRSTIPLCNALRITLESLRTALSSEKNCSYAANLASKKPTPTSTILIDQKAKY